jgi:hypothetical protein
MPPSAKRFAFPVGRVSGCSILRWFVALLLLAPLVVFSCSVISWHGPYGKDASYYFNIADNVARGNGFISNVSLYFEGLRLPARATIYPVWPAMLGLIGRFTGIVLRQLELFGGILGKSLPASFDGRDTDIETHIAGKMKQAQLVAVAASKFDDGCNLHFLGERIQHVCLKLRKMLV